MHWRNAVLPELPAIAKEMLSACDCQGYAAVRAERARQPATHAKILYAAGAPRELELDVKRNAVGNP
jgi:hypothetical protein